MSKDKIIMPAHILIIRHAEKENPNDAEKPEDGTGLSYKGQLRAQGLAEKCKLPITPDFFIAAQTTKHSQRPFETILPIASKAGQSIITDYKDDDYKVLAKDLFSKKKYDGKRILIAWHHGKIPELIDALGARPMNKRPSPIKNGKWDETVYGQVAHIVLNKVFFFSQQILYGD